MTDLDPWREYADACCEHDPAHGRRALAEMVPHPRTPFDEAEWRRSVHNLSAGIPERTPARWRLLLAQVITGQPVCLCGGQCER